jgi:hypothetical protein
MFNKYYLSRATTKAMSAEYPIGDPFGGPAYGEYNDPVSAGIMGAATIGGALISSSGAKSAAQTQADAAARAQGQVLEAGRQGAEKYQPYVEAGKTALSDMSVNRPYFQQQFGAADLNAAMAPGYAFRLKQGQGANLAASNLTGGAVSGNALRSLQDYTQNFASGEYANAFNQFQAQRTNIYNQLSDIAKMGLTGATGQANALIGTGTNVASLTSGLGNAQAASQIAQGNIMGNALQSLGNIGGYYAMNQMNQPQSYENALSSTGYTTSGAGADLTGGAGFTVRPA